MAERSFAPTASRREQARKDGRFPRGRDLTPIAVVIGALLFLIVFGGKMGIRMSQMLSESLHSGAAMSDGARLSLSTEQFSQSAREAIIRTVWCILPMLAIVWLLAVATQWSQVGGRWLGHQVIPDLNRIDPSAGLARIFRSSNWVDGALILFRLFAGALVVTCSLWFSKERFSLMDHPQASVGTAIHAACWVVLTASVTLAVIAIGEYAYRCWKFERELWMTAEEMRAETQGQSGELRVQPAQQDRTNRQRLRATADADDGSKDLGT